MKHMERRMKVTLWLLSWIILMQTYLYADMGPKPSLTIYVKNAPEGTYYLDLLQQLEDYEIREDGGDSEYADLPLYSYQIDGWQPVLLKKHNVGGSLMGQKDPVTGLMKHQFYYTGVPDTFKVVIQNQDGSLVTSNVLTPGQYHSVVLFDYQTRKAQSVEGLQLNIIGSHERLIGAILFAMLFTVIIEILVGKVFGVGPKRVIIKANVVTQILLHMVMIGAFYLGLDKGSSGLFMIMEALVVVIEYSIYKRELLTKVSEEGRLRWIKYYVLTANIMTLTMGLLIQI